MRARNIRRGTTLERSRARKDKGAWSFVQLPHILLRSTALNSVSGRALKSLVYLAAQFSGSNNGDLQFAWNAARLVGWRSRASHHLSLQELEHAKLIIRTRQGGKNRCNLYALAWFAVDANEKLDYPWCTGTRTPENEWRKAGQITTPQVGQPTPQVGQKPTKRGDSPEHYPTSGLVTTLSAQRLPH
ncbi:MAG TPA: hypothetical protein VGC79_08305 [Polyangiaceae bacterium]